jgi:SAM-dependent methyltransferase
MIGLAVMVVVTAAAGRQPARTPDVGFEPTPHAVADAMLTLARVTPGDVVYDLGSGDGRLVIRAAEKYGVRAVGVEIDPALVSRSRQAARERGVADRVRIIEGDLFTADISEATVVTLFLSPSVNQRLAPKLRQELKPGTRVVSHLFMMGSWAPTETARTPDGADLFLWTVPRRPLRTPDTDAEPTPPAVVDAMLRLARVTADDVVYDLGSGDGRIVIAAAQKYGARGVGVELVPSSIEKSRQVARDGEVADAVRFIEGDLFTTDLSEATVVTLALSASVNARLAPKLGRELRPGTRIVSRRFGIDGWTPSRIERAADGSDLFLWIVPAR